MKKLDWRFAPEWATHMIQKICDPNKGNYRWAHYDEASGDYKITATHYLCFHPHAYIVTERRPK